MFLFSHNKYNTSMYAYIYQTSSQRQNQYIIQMCTIIVDPRNDILYMHVTMFI